MDGNPLDASSWAVYAALQCTRIPSTEVFKGESGQLEDFEIAGDMCESAPLMPALSPVPITVTVSKVRHPAPHCISQRQIAEDCPLLLDASASEEACVLAAMVISISAQGLCHTARKFGGGLLSGAETLRALQCAKEASASIYPQLDTVRNTTLREDKLYPDIPPMRLGLLA
jgi:exosome complex RNA-binding protein Rrp42 (RNase PH superfamily)